MKLIIKSCNHDAKIQAIKTYRTVSKLGLKEAKFAIDGLYAGEPISIQIAPEDKLAVQRELEAGGFVFEFEGIEINRSQFIEALTYFPSDMTVAKLREVLIASGQVFG